MKKLHPTTQFKKDFKRYATQPDKVEAFERVAQMLMEDKPLPRELKRHSLKGNYKGCLECHIGNDYLLIWIDGNIIDLVRIGSHAELFGR